LDGSPCAKVGFTFSVGGDMERRRLAGMKPASLFHHRKIKKFKKISKMRKAFKASNLRICFLKIFHKKQDSG
jgi:hypothetical protein